MGLRDASASKKKAKAQTAKGEGWASDDDDDDDSRWEVTAWLNDYNFLQCLQYSSCWRLSDNLIAEIKLALPSSDTFHTTKEKIY